MTESEAVNKLETSVEWWIYKDYEKREIAFKAGREFERNRIIDAVVKHFNYNHDESDSIISLINN